MSHIQIYQLSAVYELSTKTGIIVAQPDTDRISADEQDRRCTETANLEGLAFF